MSLDWMARQLSHQPGGLNLNEGRYNPRPAGVIRNGSTTHKVLEFLQRDPARYFNHAAILWATKCTPKALSWGLIYLQRMGYVEIALGGDVRNPRYAKYRIKGETHVQAQVSEAPKARGLSVPSDAPGEVSQRQTSIFQAAAGPETSTVTE